MSSSDRRFVLAGLAAGAMSVSGCLRPMLARGGAASRLRGRIALPKVSDRFSYFLDESLVERLGRGGADEFRLEIVRKITARALAISQDNAATRITLLVVANWELKRASDGRAVLKDRVVVQSGYNATSSLYATRQTRRDIERRLARDLGERIARVILARAGEALG